MFRRRWRASANYRREAVTRSVPTEYCRAVSDDGTVIKNQETILVCAISLFILYITSIYLKNTNPAINLHLRELRNEIQINSFLSFSLLLNIFLIFQQKQQQQVAQSETRVCTQPLLKSNRSIR